MGKKTILIVFILMLSAAPCFADDDSNSGFMGILGSLLGGSSSNNQSNNGYNNGYNNNGYYDDGYYGNNPNLDQAYENVRRDRNSVAASERNLNQAYADLQAKQRAGQDTTAEVENINLLKKGYQDNLNNLSQNQRALNYYRQQAAQQGGFNGYNNNYNNGGYNNGFNRRRNNYYDDQYGGDLAQAQANLDRDRNSMASTEYELRRLQNQLDQERAEGKDTTATLEQLNLTQKGHQDNLNNYERSRRELYRENNIRGGGRRRYNDGW